MHSWEHPSLAQSSGRKLETTAIIIEPKESWSLESSIGMMLGSTNTNCCHPPNTPLIFKIRLAASHYMYKVNINTI